MSQTTAYNDYDSEGRLTKRFLSRDCLVSGDVDELWREYGYRYNDEGMIDFFDDRLGQLTREDNRALNKSYVWTYDNAGNILSKNIYAFTTGTLGTVQSTMT